MPATRPRIVLLRCGLGWGPGRLQQMPREVPAGEAKSAGHNCRVRLGQGRRLLQESACSLGHIIRKTCAVQFLWIGAPLPGYVLAPTPPTFIPPVWPECYYEIVWGLGHFAVVGGTLTDG